MSAKPFPMMIMGAMLLLPIAKPAWSEVDRQDIEAIVRDYLIANPEVVVDALRAYESKRQTEAEQAARAALLANQSSLEQDPTTPLPAARMPTSPLLSFSTTGAATARRCCRRCKA
ncbi:MAG: hypothetical protein HC834_01250 [Rhodospirillales bacterium]|nr:hypothetical protein [Rhodospirillales bacterium]